MNRNAPEVGKNRLAPLLTSIKSVDEENRTIEFVASTETPDRYGDVLRVDGWRTKNYMKNPVFLWGHRSSEPPIGKTVKISIQKSPPALIQKVQFARKEEYPFAETIYRLYIGGYMKAVSVGFRPMKGPIPIMDEDTGVPTGGYEFTDMELMELSAVPLPANPEALMKSLEGSDDIFAAAGMSRGAFVAKCGLMNPAWTNMVPGVTYSEEDEETEERAVTESLKDVVTKAIEKTNKAVSDLQSSIGSNGDLSTIKSALEILGGAVDATLSNQKAFGEKVAEKAEVIEIRSMIEAVRQRIDKNHGSLAKEDSLSDIVALVTELREKVESLSSGVLKKQALSELGVSLVAIRSSAENLHAVVAKAADMAQVITKVNEIGSRVEALSEQVAKEETVEAVRSYGNETRARVESIAASMATKADIAELRSMFEDGCKRIDALVEKYGQLAVAIKGGALRGEDDRNRTLCPYTDDAVSSANLAASEGEIEKHTSSAAWRRMATVVIGDPSLRSSYRLVHHDADGFRVSPSGVWNCLVEVEKLEIRAADRSAAREHLIQHAKKVVAKLGLPDFDAAEFVTRLDELGRVYRTAALEGDAKTASLMEAKIKEHVETISIAPAPKAVDPVAQFLGA